MTKDSSEAVQVIKELTKSIEDAKEIWDELRANNPSFEQTSAENWRQNEARLWIHGATHAMEIADLDQWLFAHPPNSETARDNAMCYYREWEENLAESEDHKYLDLTCSDLPAPLQEETFVDYIIRLSQIVEEEGWGPKKRGLAIRSFLHYMRETKDQDEVAFIEHIFPQKLDLRANRIIRKIRPQVRPISQEIAGALVKELASRCIHGRPNAVHHYCEALCMVWMCLASSRIRLPRTLESVHEVMLSSIVSEEGIPYFLTPNLFGPYKVRLGTYAAKFIRAVGEIPSPTQRTSILQTPLRDLRKPLNKVLESLDLPPEVGEITFLTFLFQPHHVEARTR